MKISHVTDTGSAPGRGANLDYAMTDLLPVNDPPLTFTEVVGRSTPCV